jgi:hypothetical protein
LKCKTCQSEIAAAVVKVTGDKEVEITREAGCGPSFSLSEADDVIRHSDIVPYCPVCDSELDLTTS